MSISNDHKKLIEDDKAILIGQGPWIKNAAYWVYKVEDLFVVVIVVDQMNCEVEYDSAEYISEKEIENYI